MKKNDIFKHISDEDAERIAAEYPTGDKVQRERMFREVEKRVSGEYFDCGSYKSIEFVPEKEDLKYLRSFKFEDLTFRGTVEYRSSCTQPVKDVMTVAAFHTGLSVRLHELAELVESDRTIYMHGYSAAELQDMLSKRDIPAFIDRKELSAQLIHILDIAAAGLKDRGKGEEKHLTALYDRAERLTNPAREMLTGIANGADIRHYIEEYSKV